MLRARESRPDQRPMLVREPGRDRDRASCRLESVAGAWDELET